MCHFDESASGGSAIDHKEMGWRRTVATCQTLHNEPHIIKSPMKNAGGHTARLSTGLKFWEPKAAIQAFEEKSTKQATEFQQITITPAVPKEAGLADIHPNCSYLSPSVGTQRGSPKKPPKKKRFQKEFPSTADSQNNPGLKSQRQTDEHPLSKRSILKGFRTQKDSETNRFKVWGCWGLNTSAL